MLRQHKRLTKKELKKDPLVIFMAQAVDFIRDEWLKIASTVLAVVLVLVVGFLIVKGKKKSDINAYDAAMTALVNNAPEAMDLLKRVVEDHGGSRYAGDALIRLANSSYQMNDYDNAEKYFQQYIKKFSDDAVSSFNAFSGLGSVYEEQGKYKMAGETYERFINDYSKSVFRPLMHLNAGKAYFLSGDKDAARRNFLAISENYEDSKEKQEADYFLELLN